MKILVTGATGFIGAHLTRKLIRQHHEVTALLRTESKKKLIPSKAEIIKGDMSIFRNEDLVLPEFDVIIHLAGAIFANSPHEYHNQNCETTKDLVRCIVRQSWTPKRFLYASSLAAAGPSGDENILTEDDECHPIEAYGHAKLMTEEFLSTVKAFPTTCFRPAIVLGPGDVNTLALFKMAQFRVGMSIDGKPQMLSFIDVDDLNEAILCMIADESTEHKVYFVAHPDIITNEEIFMTLGEVMRHRVFILPVPKIGLKWAVKLSEMASERFGWKNQLDEKQEQQLLNHFMCSGDKLDRELDWEAKRNLKASISKAYNGYRALGML
ncbi:MAG: NAD(P)-dependent oxidoreductase [Bacteroidetes bacterium]|nr:NAD(P)-dependent oxidoreductase [Bacteroidota bacterium]